MGFLIEVLSDAVHYLTGSTAELLDVVWLTIVVAGLATVIGVVVGVPLGLALGLWPFRGRGVALTLVNLGMGMPPVLAGLFLLLLVWDDGPLGSLGLVFTPAAMVIAQALLAIPIAAGVTAGAVRNLSPDAFEQLRALRLPKPAEAALAGKEVAAGIVAAIAAAFGRVVSEVGAVLIVGGNIKGETRVLTTAIVQEARQARFGAAVGLGAVLLLIALAVNVVLTRLQLREHARG